MFTVVASITVVDLGDSPIPPVVVRSARIQSKSKFFCFLCRTAGEGRLENFLCYPIVAKQRKGLTSGV